MTSLLIALRSARRFTVVGDRGASVRMQEGIHSRALAADALRKRFVRPLQGRSV